MIMTFYTWHLESIICYSIKIKKGLEYLQSESYCMTTFDQLNSSKKAVT